MKAILKLPESRQVHEFVESLWRTDIFRHSHRAGGFVFSIVDRFGRIPRFYSEMSDPYLERAHFNVWWSGFHPRSYDSPVRHDLYLLHELAHGASMVHIKGQPYEAFCRAMVDNELWASVISEIVVYFALPELRALSFSEEIYADRFLRDHAYGESWNRDPDRFVTEIAHRRRQSMFFPKAEDRQEQWLAQFIGQNEKWCEVWRSRFDEVEGAMETLARGADRSESLDRHIDWLCSPEVAEGGLVPFPEQARAFASIYWKRGAAPILAGVTESNERTQPPSVRESVCTARSHASAHYAGRM